MSSELLFTLAGLVLVIVGGWILYDLKNAPIINDEKEPEQFYENGVPIGPKYRPGKGGWVGFSERPPKRPGQGGVL